MCEAFLRFWVVIMPILPLVVSGTVGAEQMATEAAVYTAVPLQHTFDGVVEATNQSTMSAETSGRIIDVRFDVNDFVAKGNVILRFNDTDQQARFNQAEAEERVANAQLREAEDEYNRVKNLSDRKVVSQADLDRTKAKFDGAKAALDAARARVVQTREELEHTVVRAPYSGVVVARHVELGESVQVGKPLMTGFSLEKLRVNVAVPQDLGQAVRSSLRADVYLSHATEPVRATDLTVFPYADPLTHSFQVRVPLPPQTPRVYPGMLVKVTFTIGDERRLTVPRQAVVRRGEVSGVYLVTGIEGAAPQFRRVLLGRPYGERVEVLAGLQENDAVALDPLAATRAAVAVRADK